MKIIYISISGNTRSFVQHLASYAQQQHEQNSAFPLIELQEVTENSALVKETAPFFTFVPTYLDGGNGVDSGYTEILTEVVREYLAYEDNYRQCLGVVGSGNKNFNNQYCLTAKQYAEQFGFPFLADYELRGTQADLERIYPILCAKIAE